MKPGLIHVYTGDGKGKTTCAAGLALRASGRGLRVLWTSFLKDFDSGEFMCRPAFDLIRGEPVCGFWPFMEENERRRIADEHSSRLRRAFDTAADGYDMLILDEACCAASIGALDTGELTDLLRGKPAGLEVVLTGRNAPSELTELADYVTELKMIKHPYEKGINARLGIEK